MRRHSGGFRMLSAMKPRRAHAFLVVLGLILSACSGQVVSETFGNVGTELPEPTTATASGSAAATFDLGELRKLAFVDECAHPTIVDEAFCEEVDFDGMTADGRAFARAHHACRGYWEGYRQICYWISDVRVAYLGRVPLAEFFNTVLDRDGRAAATCAVP